MLQRRSPVFQALSSQSLTQPPQALLWVNRAWHVQGHSDGLHAFAASPSIMSLEWRVSATASGRLTEPGDAHKAASCVGLAASSKGSLIDSHALCLGCLSSVLTPGTANECLEMARTMPATAGFCVLPLTSYYHYGKRASLPEPIKGRASLALPRMQTSWQLVLLSAAPLQK